MPNGSELLDDLTLEKMISGWSEPEKFLARTIMDVKRTCQERDNCPSFQFSRKQVVVGASGVSIVSLVVSILFEVGKKLLGS